MTDSIVTGSFDNLGSRDIRFLEEAARRGSLHASLWSDTDTIQIEGRAPKFPEAERQYLLQSIRYVANVALSHGLASRHALPQSDSEHLAAWVVREEDDAPEKRAFCQAHGMDYEVLNSDVLAGFPILEPSRADDGVPRKKVLVTGCFDWFHSGHVRFFEEVSELGDLYVVVGHDANIRLLKGDGHPLFPAEERRYVVQSVRFVTQALISTGHGWLDAEPEIEAIRPDIYAVNEDGDKPEKRRYCEQHGLEYVVLKRIPKQGLPKRESTALRGF